MTVKAEVSSPLLAQLTIAGKRAPSRVVFGSHATNYAVMNRVSDTAVAYYEERARFGVGLIAGAPDNVDSRFAARGTVNAADPEAVDGYRLLADAIHRHGALVVGALAHPGATGFGDLTPNWSLEVAPSAVPLGPGTRTPRALELEEIREIVHLFGRSARHQAEGGLDGTELDATAGLFADFASPAANKRDDAYGGSATARLRFLAEVLEEIRTAVGSDHLLGLRAEFSQERAEPLASVLCSGLLDYVVLAPVADLRALTAATEWARGAAPGDLAVIGAVEASARSGAEEALAAAVLDAVALTDALIADPEWLQADDGCGPRPAVAEWRGSVSAGAALTCPVNPSTGRELKWGAGKLDRVGEPGRVVVVGGGPAGMKAAELAARAGHRVTLVERGAELGGWLGPIAGLPGCVDFRQTRDWLAARLAELGVQVELGRTVADASVDAGVAELLATAVGDDEPLRLAAEMVVVATGAVAGVPDAPPDSIPVLAAADVVRGATVPGRRALVYDVENRHAGAAVATRLAAGGARLTYATPGLAIAAGCGARDQILAALYSAKAELLAGWALVAIGPTGATLKSVFTGERREVAADALVAAEVPVPADNLYWRLHGLGATVVRAGDCVAPRDVAMAFYAGEQAGRDVARPGGPPRPPIVEDKAPTLP